MKRRDIALLNYTLFIIIAVVLGYVINTYNHDFPINIEKLQKIEDEVGQKLNITLNFNLGQINNKKSVQENIQNLFSKQFYLEYDLKSPESNVLSENKNRYIRQFINLKAKQMKQIKIDIICENKTKSTQIVSGNLIKYYAGNTCENLTQEYLKELRRVALTFSQNLLEYSYEQRFFDKDIFFNIYIYQTFNSNQTTDEDIKNIKKLLSNQIIQFSSSLSIQKSQIRINFKTIHPQELMNLNINNVLRNDKYIQFSAVESIQNQIQENYHNRINFRDYYNRQIIIFLNQGDIKISDKDDTFGYYLNHQDDIFISSAISNTNKLQTIFNKAIIELYDLEEMFTLQDSLQRISLDLNLSALSSYFIKREFYCAYQALHSQAQSVIKLRNTKYIIFKPQSVQIIDKWIQQTEQILSFKLDKANNLEKIVYIQEDLNKIEEIGYLDYFSNEYLMGVYLPVIVPVAYPYILGVLGVFISIFIIILKDYYFVVLIKYNNMQLINYFIQIYIKRQYINLIQSLHITFIKIQGKQKNQVIEVLKED